MFITEFLQKKNYINNKKVSHSMKPIFTSTFGSRNLYITNILSKNLFILFKQHYPYYEIFLSFPNNLLFVNVY